MTNPHAWHLAELSHISGNGLRVFSTFSCGGGSSMGYKLAGYEMVGANDIDPEMQRHYERNLHPRHYFLCPVADLLSLDLPDELHTLDVLDGSPLCSTFSMSGNREKDWGKNKHFREGQSEQVLSDLFFDYLDLVGKLRPKVAIAENVAGMLAGNAKGYVKAIIEQFREMGYRPQVFLLDAANCGVPQRRQRVFFCALRTDIEAPKLSLQPQMARVSASEATSDLQVLTPEEIEQTRPSPKAARLWPDAKPGEHFDRVTERLGEGSSDFSRFRLDGNRPSATLTAQCKKDAHHWAECRNLTVREFVRLSSFPDDYEFRSSSIASYLMGMSVPPKLMRFVASEVAGQWLNR